jgi:hypothetical protein
MPRRMMHLPAPRKFPPELWERARRLVREARALDADDLPLN